MTTAYDRWAELAERDAIGDMLTASEQTFLEEYASTDPVAAAELELFGSFALMDEAGDESELAFAERAVQRALADSAKRGAAPRPIRPGRWLVWGAGSVAAAAAAVAVFVHGAAPPVAPVATGVSVIEYVAVQAQLGGQTAQNGAHAAVGAELAAIGGPVCVAVEPHIHACLASGSKVRLTAVGNGKRRLDLLSGRVAMALNPLPVGERLSVVANGVWSTAVGTAFSVELEPDGTVRTVVHEGKVAVGAEGATDIVDGHKIGLSSSGGLRIEPPVAHSELETPDWVELAQVAGRPIEGPTAEVASAPAPMVAVNPESLPQGPSRAAHAAPSHATTPEPAAEAPQAAQVTPASLLAVARQALREQRWTDAGATYRQLVDGFPATPEAHTVLVSLAKLELDRLGQPAAALQHLDAYLERGGALSREARLARVKAYRALGRTSDEAAAIDDILASDPNGLEAEQLRERRQQLPH